MKKSHFISAMMLITFFACTNDKFEDLSINETKQQEFLRVLTPEEAIDIAYDAISMLDDSENTRGFIDRKVDTDNVKCRIIESTRANGNADTLYYVVNYVDNEGFAIVSADRNEKTPLIAVTESGNYSPGEKTGNPGFDMYINTMEARMMVDNSTRSENDGPLKVIRTEMYYRNIANVLPQLRNLRWGQDEPYNYYCYNSNNINCAAGCVAVALAQIMAKHSYPPSIQTTFTAPNYNGTNSIVELDWSLMKGNTSSGFIPIIPRSLSEQNTMIALLMREIGKQISTTYIDIFTASAAISNVDDGLPHFGYTCDAVRNYTWSLVKDDIDAGNVTLIEGTPNSNPNSNNDNHAWVADGYRYRELVYDYYQEDSNGMEVLIGREVEPEAYLHINWGWLGLSNGYFWEGNFNPGSITLENLDSGCMPLNSGAYNINNKVICGIKPLNN